MRTKVAKDAPQQVLMHVLDAFAQELIDASDEEIREAAKDLGMDLRMRWSAAFAGVSYPAAEHFQMADFFDLEALKRLSSGAGRERTFSEAPLKAKRRSRRPGRIPLSTGRKPPDGK